MAYQEGPIQLTGTLYGITYYRMNGVYHARMKSSLTAKKFWKHKAFEGSRRSCRRFAEGNKLASKVYRQQPKEKRLYALFCQLKTSAIHYLKLGLTAEEALPYVRRHAEQEQYILPNRVRKPRQPKAFPFAIAIEKDKVLLSATRAYQLQQKLGTDRMLSLAESVLYAIPLFHLGQQRLKARA